MPEKLEEKAEEEPKIVNDLYKKKAYGSFKKPRLYEYYMDLIQNSMLYPKNFQKTFTP